MKTILITGGAGFIGSHLSRFLLNKKFRVIAVDNFLTGSADNIRDLKNKSNFDIINHNISKPLNINREIDYVLHFASPASPVDYSEKPIQTLKSGSLSTHNALGIAKSKKATFMLASSSEVYGDPQTHPQKETYWGNVNPIGPRSVYDESKRYAEALTMTYHNVHKIDVRIARIFNTFGSNMRKRDGRAVPNFITQALSGKPLTVYGKGDQTRSFCYVSDLIKGIYLLMLSEENMPINLGNPDERTILELARLIIKLTESNSEISFKPLPEDDPKNRCPDISMAKKILNWKPEVETKEGLRKTIEWFRKE